MTQKAKSFQLFSVLPYLLHNTQTKRLAEQECKSLRHLYFVAAGFKLPDGERGFMLLDGERGLGCCLNGTPHVAQGMPAHTVPF
jgi:hypothetical protein